VNEDFAMKQVVIVSAVRTPIGKFQGSLQSYSAPQLGALVVRAAMERAGVDPAAVDECVMGCVLQAGLGQNPARQAAIHGGIPARAGAFTVNQVCGSGLKAVALAAQAIQTGNAQVLVAGGMESMSNAPYLLPKARGGYRMGDGALVDAMIHDGLWEAYKDFPMGIGGEMIAEKYGITREEQDAFAVQSHKRATEATLGGHFRGEILPVEIPASRGGESLGLVADEAIRQDTILEALAKLKPAFKEDGTVTAGNAPPVSDGAAAMLVASVERARELALVPMAIIRAEATAGREPEWFGLAPIDAVRKVVRKAGWTAEDVDLYEIGEAFSAQALAVIRELELDPARVNVNGGAVALGHPIGASGARVLTTLLHAMARRGKKRGVASLCLGGGNAVALAVERQ
jgi:acetyl-CoA C-acetyltransferase